MTIDVLRAAKHLGKVSNWTFSNLEMQKILYICHMLYLGQIKRPLLEGTFEAWDYGPVHPDLYHFLKYYGSESIPESVFDDVKDLNESNYQEEIKVFNQMAANFPHPSGAKLVGITHWSEGAWGKNYTPGERGIIISNSDVFEEYEKRYKEPQGGKIENE